MKRFIRWSLLCLFLALFAGMNAGAASYNGLAATLVDLAGWEAGEPEGMHMDMGGTTIANANREYRKEGAEIDAAITAGGPAMGPAAMGEMKMETDKERASVSTVDGYRVHASFSKTDNSGAVVVSLLQHETGGAIFTLAYEGISDDAALELARKFDWDKMKEEAGKLR